MLTTKSDISTPRFGAGIADEIVEISLLLPTRRAEALIDLSRRRQTSVGQILRGLIDRALAGDDRSA